MPKPNLQDLVTQLRDQGRDDAEVEVKSLVVPPGQKKPKSAETRSLWESISAFANTRGGLVLLGLDERTGFAPAKGFNPQDVSDRIHQGLNPSDATGRRLSPVPEHDLRIEDVDGSPVVVLTVQPLAVNGPCHLPDVGIAKGSFKRVGDADRHLTALEIYEAQHKFDALSVDTAPVPGSSPEDLSTDLVDAVRRRLASTASRALGNGGDEWLRHMNVVTSGGELSLAGLLALGTYPQHHFPRLFIDVAVHPGNEKGSTDSTRFIDRKLCEGNLLDMMQDALLAIRRNLRVRRVVTGAEGRDVLEIPEDALRETLANAVMHRDYSPLALGSGINVDIFRDRVEVSSPGGFPGAKSSRPESLVDGLPAPRNRFLARLLMEIPWPGREGGVLAESNGSGIPRMFQSMQQAGLPVPGYDVDIARVTVTLRRFGLLDPDTNDWLTAELGEGFDPTDGIALVLAHEFGSISTTDLRTQTGQDSDALRHRLRALVDGHKLVESSPDHFRLPLPVDRLTPTQQDIIACLSTEQALSTRDIAAATGRTTGTLRPQLRGLVESGAVLATAPPTSRNRRYLLPEQ